MRVRLIEGMGKHQDEIVMPEDNCKTYLLPIVTINTIKVINKESVTYKESTDARTIHSTLRMTWPMPCLLCFSQQPPPTSGLSPVVPFI